MLNKKVFIHCESNSLRENNTKNRYQKILIKTKDILIAFLYFINNFISYIFRINKRTNEQTIKRKKQRNR